MTRGARAMCFSLLLVASSGCSSGMRFADRPPVWRVDDQRETPEPEARDFVVAAYAADIFAFRPLDRALSVPSLRPALNTNSLDEVPDSSWFRNRIGRYAVSAAEAAQGPDQSGPPRPPLVVKSSKTGGGNAGFVAQDATGRRFLIKFDNPDNPELQTASSVIVNRFFWTIGYNVPVDHVMTLARRDLAVAPGAHFENAVGDRRRFDEGALDEILARVPHYADGTFRITSSEMVSGKAKGGFAMAGRRRDDPNDVIPHEHRRELRGLRVFSAWLDHTDMKEDNTLDVWVNEGGKHYLRHYLLDFGEALGGHAAEKHRREDGYEHFWDWAAQGRALISFGLWRRAWEDREAAPFAAVGSLPAEDFDPRSWHEAYPFAPFAEMDAADAYWAAKIVMRFERPLIDALVATGKLSEPRAAHYLGDAIALRQRKIGEAYLTTVTDLDDFRVEDNRLCATSLSSQYGLYYGGVLELLDSAGHVRQSSAIPNSGHVCLPPQPPGYRVVSLRIRRGTLLTPAMQVHLTDRTRLLGLVRI